MRAAIASLLWLSVVGSVAAQDRIFDELRFGASASVQGGHSHEDGLFPEVTAFFDPFDRAGATGIEKIMRPRLHLGTSIGTSGSATQFFTGVSWTLDFSERFFAEAGFGGVIHTDKLDHDEDGPDLGCRLLFHEYVGAGFRLDTNWSVISQVSHSSHGNLCDGPNSGMTRAGLQLGYNF